MSNWIFISKDGQDPFINQFAQGCNTTVINSENFIYENSTNPLVFRGILKKKIIKKCWEDQRTFYYMDTGYFGNEISPTNPQGLKLWHRIVKNNLQHNEIIKRPADRFQKFNKKFVPWKKLGRSILIAAPDEKPCKFYGIDKESWINETVEKIKQFTDRPIVIRERAPLRIDRIASSTLKEALDNDVFALVTYNSNAATESIFYGIPAFVLAPCNAAMPVSKQDLSQIENPYYPTSDKLFEWACHLSYGQFSMQEIKSGKAQEMLKELW